VYIKQFIRKPPWDENFFNFLRRKIKKTLLVCKVSRRNFTEISPKQRKSPDNAPKMR